jgi:hypothetical protein
MSDVTEQGSRFLRDLGDAANRNPLSAALIGMGVMWLFAGRAGAHKIRGLLGSASEATGQSLESAGSAVSSGASAARRAMGESAETMRRRGSDWSDTWSDSWDAASRAGRDRIQRFSEYGSSVTEKGSGQLQDFANSLTDMFQRQPLALGAIGAAIGASIAAALPLSKMEVAQLGEAAEQATESVKEHAGRAMDAAADEARKQGLTTEGIKSAAEEATTRLGRVVDAANEGIADPSKAGQAKTGQAKTDQARTVQQDTVQPDR